MRPIRRISNPPSFEALEEQEAASIARHVFIEELPELSQDPLFEVHAEDRGDYFAVFAFVASQGLLDALGLRRFQLSDALKRRGIDSLVYPRSWTP